jgi:hypothetical protein
MSAAAALRAHLKKFVAFSLEAVIELNPFWRVACAFLRRMTASKSSIHDATKAVSSYHGSPTESLGVIIQIMREVRLFPKFAGHQTWVAHRVREKNRSCFHVLPLLGWPSVQARSLLVFDGLCRTGTDSAMRFMWLCVVNRGIAVMC